MAKAIKSKTRFSEAELVQLLAINKAITEAKTAVELLTIIREKVMQLLPFTDTGILIVEKDGLYHYDMAVNIKGWDNSESNLLLQQQEHLNKIPHKDSYVDFIIKKLEKEKQPIIEDWQLVMEQWEHPFFPIVKHLGFKQGLVALLKSGGRTYGGFWLNSLEKSNFSEEQFPLFQAVAEQVSVAVANIIANEELVHENRTKAILLNISEHIAAINNRKELFAIIINEIKPIIPIDDTGILVLNKEGTLWRDWTNIDNYQNSLAAANLKEAGFTEYIEIDHLMALSFAETGILAIDDYAKINHPFAPIMAEAGLKEFMFTPLISQGKTIGSLFFDSEKYNTYSPAYFDTFRSIANMIASAVANILANEEILEREREKDILLTISQKLSKATKPDELLQIIINEVKPIFHFYDTGILVIDENAKGVYDLSVVYPHIDNSEMNDLLNNKGYYKDNQVLKLENSVVEWILQQFQLKRIPFVFDYLQDYSTYTDGNLLSDLRDGGYISAWMCPLIQQGKTFGVLSLNFTKDQTIQLEKQTLFLALADRIASSLANILANEEILGREREKTQLLEISEAMAKVQNSKQLLKVIYEKIKLAFPYDSAGLFILDKEGNNCYEITDYEVLPDAVQQEISKKGLLGPFAMSAFKKDFWFFYDEPTITSIGKQAEYVKDVQNGKAQFEIGIAHGLKDFLCGPLNCAGKKIGMLCFSVKEENFYSEKHISLFKSISDLIAIAVANILANEEIVDREEEKTLLYKIASTIANVKDRNSLMKLILEDVKNIFHFYDVGLAIVDRDGTTCTDWSILTPEISPSDANYELHARQLHKIPFKDSLFQKLIQQVETEGRPLIVKFNEQLKADNPDLKNLFEVEMKHGYKETLFTYLKSGNKVIGSFNINSLTDDYFTPQQYHLFQAVADLIAIAVANILANEEILEREKEKTQLLEISEAIATIRDKDELWKVMMEKIKPILNFKASVSTIYSDDHLQYCYYLYSVTKELPPSLQTFMGVYKPLKNTSDEWVFNQGDVCKLTIAEKQTIAKANPETIKILTDAGIKFNLYIKLKVGGKILGVQHYHFEDKTMVNEKLISLAKAITDFIAMALANILVNEQLQLKANEIVTLNKQLKAQNDYLLEEVEQAYNFDEMIGQNPKFAEVCKSIGLVAKTDSTVLILGETGTGKELVARAIHNNSPRKNKPLIKLNCAALPANLIESELFGHERGAFTGAFDRRIGKFELAHGSTLFLDEVGELPLELQAKLLRALQEKEIERLGSNKTISVDVRIIAATNRELEKEVQTGKFRQDLYYRLHIFPITLPSLKERKEDIPLLAAHFLERYTKKTGKKIMGFSSKAMQDMMSYNWPGNIRELEHVIERCVILGSTKLVQDMNLLDMAKRKTISSANDFVVKTWEEQERDYILEILKVTNGKVKGKGSASELLQLPATTLQSKMNKLGIKRQHWVE